MPNHRTEYPIPFTQNSDPRIVEALATRGLSHSANNTSITRDWLIGQNLFFALHRPLGRGEEQPSRAFLHPEYMSAALQGVPAKTRNQDAGTWQSVAAEHLTYFAEQPQALRLIVDGLTKYYSGIAQAATFLKKSAFPDTSQAAALPDKSTHPYLAARPDKGQTIAPLNYVGVSDRSALKFDFRPELDDEENEYARFRDAGMGSHFYDGRKSLRRVRVHVPVRALARGIRLRIPGIGSERTQQAITDGFAALKLSETPMAGELFMLGQVMIAGNTNQPTRAVSDIFDIS